MWNSVKKLGKRNATVHSHLKRISLQICTVRSRVKFMHWLCILEGMKEVWTRLDCYGSQNVLLCVVPHSVTLCLSVLLSILTSAEDNLQTFHHQYDGHPPQNQWLTCLMNFRKWYEFIVIFRGRWPKSGCGINGVFRWNRVKTITSDTSLRSDVWDAENILIRE